MMLLEQNALPIQKNTEALSWMQWIRQRPSFTNPVKIVANEVWSHSSWACEEENLYFCTGQVQHDSDLSIEVSWHVLLTYEKENVVLP